MRDTELERHIGILSVITVRHGQRKTADDCTSEWEIEALPTVTRAEVHDYCRTHLSSDGIPYEQWSQQGCTAYALGYYRLYKSLGNIWTYRVYVPYGKMY